MSSSVPQGSVADSRTSSSVLDMIGRTPLVRLHRFEREIPAGIELYAKAEWQNPGGSVKDRAAKYMVLDGEKRGVIEAGGLIVEGTAGNTGIARSNLVIRRPPCSIATTRTSPRDGPFPVRVEADQQYFWCSCGRSASQPWCDGSHAGTRFEPIEFVPPLAAIFHMCGCKRSQNKPYCFGNCRGLRREARLAKEGE